MSDISIKEGEAKTLTLTIKDGDGVVVDVSAATLTFGAKKNEGGAAYQIEKEDADFDKTDAVNGIVSVVLTSTDTNKAGIYVGELKIQFSATNIDKSDDISVSINKAITD